MGTIAVGTAKKVIYKEETNWGELAGDAGGKLVRRVTATFNLTKETYESAELRTDRQLAVFKHGVRSTTGSLNGELSAGTYSDFMQALLARDFTATTLGAADDFTVATVANVTKLIRAAGSFITDGLQPGLVVRATGLTEVADNSKNLLVAAVTPLEATVIALDGVPLADQAVASSVTLTAPGKSTFIPKVAHTDKSFTVEEFYEDIAQSEVYTGNKVVSMNVQLPSTGMTTIDFSLMGKDLTQTATSQYFTAPAVQNTNGIFAAVNGALVMNGEPVALVTSADFTVDRENANATAVGSNSVAEIFTGVIRVTGNLSVYFKDAKFRSYFDGETPVSLVMALAEDSTKDSNFISFTIPKIKLGSFDKDDTSLGLTASSSFQAMINDNVTGGLPETTISIQDSTLV